MNQGIYKIGKVEIYENIIKCQCGWKTKYVLEDIQCKKCGQMMVEYQGETLKDK